MTPAATYSYDNYHCHHPHNFPFCSCKYRYWSGTKLDIKSLTDWLTGKSRGAESEHLGHRTHWLPMLEANEGEIQYAPEMHAMFWRV